MQKIQVELTDKNKRLDVFLAEKIENITRSQIQKIIKSGNITINDVVFNSPHHKVKDNDLVVITSLEKKKKEVVNKVVTEGEEPVFFSIKDIPIIEENDDYIVINKPAGLITHGDDHIMEKTLADLLLEKYPEMKKVGDDPHRPGIVHRLDKEASGLMVVARTQEAFEHLKEQFKKRRTKKIYITLVHGQTVKDEDTINFPIARSTQGFKMAAKAFTVKGEKNIEGKAADTDFNVITRFINYTLLRVRIKTGRTHQIRTHMSAYGHPIVGDKLYSTRVAREKNKKINLGRIFLTAVELEFKDSSGEKRNYKIELPDELLALLKVVK